MSRSHIVHVIETLGSGGAERLLYTNLKHLDPARFRNTVVTVFSGDDHWLGPIRDLGVPVQSLDCAGLRDLLPASGRLRQLFKADPPDLVHTHLWWADVVGRIAGRLAGAPVVSSVHNSAYDPEAVGDGSGVARHKRFVILALDRWTARLGCRRLVAVSRYVQGSAARHLRFPLGRIDLLYNPIDVDDFLSPPRRGRSEVLRDLGLPDDAVVLLNVGRVSPQKGLLYAIRALPDVIERCPPVHLVSAGGMGDRPWAERLRAEAETLGVAHRLHLLGPRADVPELLKMCDLFVFPSLHEGLGIALIEAMASGCACVATTTGPIPEVVTHGVDGWLVPPGDAVALGAAIEHLLGSPELRSTLARNAGQSAADRYNPVDAARSLTGIYESVLPR